MAFTASILTAFSILPQLVPLRRTSFLSEEEICDEKPPATAKAITHATAVKRAGSARRRQRDAIFCHANVRFANAHTADAAEPEFLSRACRWWCSVSCGSGVE